jgi:alkanesulfonate monooxygenase SsuD/methylene tetrahydromethanopterin reductase-like flavin-dependent oxidoreductase (luciferase family)
VGSPDQILERIRALEATGVRNVALQVPGTEARELIEEFGRHVIAKL